MAGSNCLPSALSNSIRRLAKATLGADFGSEAFTVRSVVAEAIDLEEVLSATLTGFKSFTAW